jgi:hypothetical protein
MDYLEDWLDCTIFAWLSPMERQNATPGGNSFLRTTSIMARNPLKKIPLYVGLTGLFCAYGCGVPPAYRTHPEFETRVKQIRNIAFLPPEVRIYEVSPSGAVELRDDWCALEKKSLEKAFVEQMKEKHYLVRKLKAENGLGKKVGQIQALYKQVNKSVQLHSYGPQIFPEKAVRFEYGVGSLEEVLAANGTDSMVFIMGFDQVSSGTSTTYLSIAVADTSGTLLWYCSKGSTGEYRLKDPSRSAMLVEDILSSFPERVE